MLVALDDGDTFPMRGRLALHGVEQGAAYGVGGELLVNAEKVDGGRDRPLGALVEEDLGERVGREQGQVGGARLG